MPRSRSRQQRLPKSAEYSAQQVEQMLQEDQANGFRTPIPEGFNFVIVSMPPAVMRAHKQRKLAWLKAKQAQQ